MSDLVLYHGSPRIVKRPVFGEGKKWNDYGQGFYTTENIDMAREWATGKDANGYVNRYLFALDSLKMLDLGNYTTLHWLTVLLINRKFEVTTSLERMGKEWLIENFNIEMEKFDIIKGYRADDSYFSFARAFLSNGISLSQLSRAMKLGKLGEQVMLRSEKAFENIRFDGYEEVDSLVYYPLRLKRDEKARQRFRELTDDDDIEGIYMRDIIRERITADDERIL